MAIATGDRPQVIYCIASNCFALEGWLDDAAVWHLFDRETLDSLLMAGHPDWQPSQRDLDLGRRILERSLAMDAVATI